MSNNFNPINLDENQQETKKTLENIKIYIEL